MNLHVPFTQTQQLGRFCCVCFSFLFFSCFVKKHFKANSRPSVISFLHTSYPSQKIMGISSHYQNAISVPCESFTKRKSSRGCEILKWIVQCLCSLVFLKRGLIPIFKFSVTALEVTDATCDRACGPLRPHSPFRTLTRAFRP